MELITRLTNSANRSPRLIIALAGGAVLLAAVIGFGVYGLVVGPRPDHAAPSPSIGATTPPGDAAAAHTVAPWSDLPTLPVTNDPLRYARAVAHALFTWDTMSGLTPDQYGNAVLVDADPSGVEASGLVSDMDNYLPSADTWQQLRTYETRQSLSISGAYIPDVWEQAAREAAGEAAGLISDGTVAVTIGGTRHRYGTWYGEPATSDHDVAFTVFVACRPAFDRCHTLRLSQLDKPLN